MSRRLVVDASAFLPALLPQERLQVHADALVDAHAQGRVELCAPPLLAHEILNALYLAVRGKPGAPPRMTMEAAQEEWRLFTELRIALIGIDDIGGRTLELALAQHRPSSYDMCYVALAERLQTTMVTADERLLHAVGGALPFVQPLWELRLGS